MSENSDNYMYLNNYSTNILPDGLASLETVQDDQCDGNRI